MAESALGRDEEYRRIIGDMTQEPLRREDIPMPQLDYSRGDIVLKKPGDVNDSLVHFGVQPPVEPIPPSPFNNPRFYEGPNNTGQWGEAPADRRVIREGPDTSSDPNWPKLPWRGSPDDTLMSPPPPATALPPQDTVIPTGPRLQPSALTPASYAGDVLSPYATGNAQVGGRSSVENVRDDFAGRIKAMVQDMPPTIAEKFKIISGYRDTARQKEVNPGVTNSRHSYGMAVDTTSDPDVLSWINNTRGKYGVDYTLRHLPNEQNHLEMVNNGQRAPISSASAADHHAERVAQAPVSATAAERTQEISQGRRSQLAEPPPPVVVYESAIEEYPILAKQGLIAGPGNKLEYWPPGEPGTPQNPRPDFIPLSEAGMELAPGSVPLDILGDIVSHHMAKKDKVIKKFYDGFVESLTPEQKETLQAQYFYHQKHEGETRSYQQWEKNTGIPAYFRGYAFKQWPDDFNEKGYTPQQKYHFDRMMDYLRGSQQAPTALGGTR